MMIVSRSLKLQRLEVILSLWVLVDVVLLSGCGVDQGKKVVAFVQATKDPVVNQAIMERYAWPIFRSLEKSGEPFDLDLYRITGNTASTTAFYSATVRRGPTEGQERKVAERQFLQLRSALDKSYAEEGSQLVDILGSVRIVDDILGRISDEKQPLYVVYVSDMVQSNGADGYDFTGNFGGKSLEACKKNLQDEIGSRLINSGRFSKAQVLVLRLDLQSLSREKGTEMSPPPANLLEIEDFWAKDFFTEFLRIGSYHIDTSKDPRRAIQEFLQ